MADGYKRQRTERRGVKEIEPEAAKSYLQKEAA
jgi:hypothetical protein